MSQTCLTHFRLVSNHAFQPLGSIRSYPPLPEDVDMQRGAKELAEQRQKKQEEKRKQRNLRAQERQARGGKGEPTPIGSESGSESLGLVSPDSDDLGHFFTDEAIEGEEDEVVEQDPKRVRTDEGLAAGARNPKRARIEAGSSVAVGSSGSGQKDWRYWLGSGSRSGSGEDQT
jgi:hypothetical protein